MDQWEYLPTYMRAEAGEEEIKAFLQQHIGDRRRVPRYLAEAMIPAMNHLGQQGWELVHMEPVAGLGSKGDVLFDGGGTQWSNVYFCVFKRRAVASSRPPGGPTPRTPPMPPGSDSTD